MKNIGVLAGVSMLAVSASAQLTLSYTVPTTIPSAPGVDNQVIPYYTEGIATDSQVVSGHGTATIQDLQVNLTITSGGYAMNGNFGAFITHTVGTTSTTAYLLSRPGKDSTHNFGYFDNAGMSITLSDKASTDVHLYQTVTIPDTIPLTGTYQPDGRSFDARTVTTANARDAMLSVFNGQTIDGTWTVTIADYNSKANDAKFTQWGLTFTNVPEPSQYAMLAGLGLIGFAAYRRFTVKVA